MSIKLTNVVELRSISDNVDELSVFLTGFLVGSPGQYLAFFMWALTCHRRPRRSSAKIKKHIFVWLRVALQGL